VYTDPIVSARAACPGFYLNGEKFWLERHLSSVYGALWSSAKAILGF